MLLQSADDKCVNQLLYDLAVDVLLDLAETAQLEEAADGDTSNMLIAHRMSARHQQTRQGHVRQLMA